MSSRIEDLAVKNENCDKSCHLSSTKLCLKCFSQEFIETLHKTHREHQKRGKFKRIFPSKIYDNNNQTNELMTEKTKLLTKWFSAKCSDDIEWC